MYLVMLLTQALSCQIPIVIKIHVRRKVCFKHKRVKNEYKKKINYY